jgi:adenosylmethionine-8-amino-7-oxononanoate aminotransferase
MANLDIFEREQLNEHVRDNRGGVPGDAGESCSTCRWSVTSAATGYFYGIELVKDKATKETFDDAESERLLRGFLSKALFDAGLYCRADDRGRPGRPALAAADLRPGALRRDGADPAATVLTEAENHSLCRRADPVRRAFARA